MSERLTSVELFTGAGGLALGVARAGYDHLGLVERDRHAVASLRENRLRVVEMATWPENIRETDVKDVTFSGLAGRVRLLAAGAPCQPFSLGGKHKGHADDRNLFPEVFRAVRELRPDAIIVENVKGLLRANFREYFDYIVAQAERPSCVPRSGEDWRGHRDRLARYAGKHRPEYIASFALLNAADYGVPQRRERVFIVALAARFGTKWTPPKPTHSEDGLLHAQYVTGEYWREHRLPIATVPDRLEARINRLTALPKPQEQPWRTVRDALRGLPQAPTLWNGNGGDPNHVARLGARSYPGHTGSPIDYPSKTLKAGDHGVPGGENAVVDSDGTIRYLTVREAARLQTFPDTYHFRGAWTECLRQLGNAVPVELARVVAASLASVLGG